MENFEEMPKKEGALFVFHVAEKIYNDLRIFMTPTQEILNIANLNMNTIGL